MNINPPEYMGKQEMLKITVDFNNLTPGGEQVIVARASDKEISEQLTNNMRVLLHEPGDFEVEAIVEPVEVRGTIWWYGTPDWSTRREIE